MSLQNTLLIIRLFKLSDVLVFFICLLGVPVFDVIIACLIDFYNLLTLDGDL